MHITNITALSLKISIETLFAKYKLSMVRPHSQGYDGTSNTQGKFNILKTLILKENENFFYVQFKWVGEIQ